MSLATEHAFNQYIFEAEETLLQLDAPPPLQSAPSELSLDVTEVAEAIRELRETVGV